MAGPTPFGDTCPYLNIANHYDVDYSVVLALAHYETFSEWNPGGRELYLCNDLSVSKQCLDDIIAQAGRFFDLCVGLP